MRFLWTVFHNFILEGPKYDKTGPAHFLRRPPV